MNRNIKGLSLIELMVALALGMILTLSIINVFLSNKRSSQVEQSFSRLQESGRAAMDLIVNDLQDTWYVGCNSGSAALIEMATDVDFDGVAGYENLTSDWSPALPTKLAGFSTIARKGSDLLNIQHGRQLVNNISTSIPAAGTSIQLSDNVDGIEQDELIVISNCLRGHLFRVTNAPATSGATELQFSADANDITNLDSGYTIDEANLVRFLDKTWFVGPSGRVRAVTGTPIFSLFRDVNGTTEEMIEGVEHMEILYGQELAGGNLRYVPASDATLNMDEVVSVRIGLLIQSYEIVLDENDSNVYQVMDETIGASETTYTHNGDRGLRRVFRTTVMLRNTPAA